MPAQAKPLENMTKHLTEAERLARAAAEEATLPTRTQVKLRMPAYVRRDKAAKAYWVATLSRMEGITLLDDLDSEALGILCAQLSRRDALGELCRQLLEKAGQEDELPLRLEAVSRLDALNSKLIALEKAILQAQGNLGLTPSGRVRLMRKRAEAHLVEEADGLFGD